MRKYQMVLRDYIVSPELSEHSLVTCPIGTKISRADLIMMYMLTVCIPLDFPIHIDTISTGLPNLYLKGHR